MPRVREESHLDDMRAAIRGDFERLARRRGGQELMQEPPAEIEPDEEPWAEPEMEETPASVSAAEVLPEQAPEPEPVASAESVPEPELQPSEHEQETPRRGFFARLLGL